MTIQEAETVYGIGNAVLCTLLLGERALPYHPRAQRGLLALLVVLDQALADHRRARGWKTD